MKIIFNVEELYRLMRKHNTKTIAQLSRESGLSSERLYMAIRKKSMSKENSWILAKFYGCHVEDLWIIDWSQ